MKPQRLLFTYFAVALLFYCPAFLSYAFTLPDTGQTNCYDAGGAVIACAGTGQDGALILNPMSYTDNGDGTITDNNTGLMWQKQDDSTGRMWGDAGRYCTNLSLGGHSDWRLPTVMELTSIVDYSGVSPTINTTYFPNTSASQNWQYWTSTTIPDFSWLAMSVSFNNGHTHTSNDVAIASNYDRCVRGMEVAISTGNGTDNGDGTVTDNVTGLIWQIGKGASINNYSGNIYSWTYALSYCNKLRLGGHSDWRLPNIKEMESVSYNHIGNLAGCVDYWSSTTVAGSPGTAWIVETCEPGVVGGVIGNTGDNKLSGNYVQCVRGGKSVSKVNYALSVTTAGTGSGIVTANSGKINWRGGAGKASYSSGTSVTLTATANSGSTFTSWSGCDSTSGNTCTVSMTAAKRVTAAFSLNTSSLTISEAGTGSGTVTSSYAGITCGTVCSEHEGVTH